MIVEIYNGYYSSIRSNNYINFNGVKPLPTQQQWNELRVFIHHIYEYKKGLRNLILTTEKASNRGIIIDKLEKNSIAYHIENLGKDKINVFFGNPDSVKVIQSFNKKELNKYTPEQDFILGTLLGYDKIQQCQRYLSMIAKNQYKK